MADQIIAGGMQILVTILGSLTPIFVERFRRRAPGTAVPSLDRPAAQERHLLDLAILLVYSAFLSAILTHSMVVSGKTPSFTGPVLAGVTAITFGTAFFLYFAWRRGIGEVTAGAMSFAALIVLLIAPGTALSPQQNDGTEAGLPLTLPVFALTYATAVAIVYASGNPLTRNLPTARRRWIMSALLILTFSTATILASAFIAETLQDPRAPRFEGTSEQSSDAHTLLNQLRTLDLSQRGVFYKIASDVALADSYRKEYFEVRQDVEKAEALRPGSSAGATGAERTVPAGTSPHSPNVSPTATNVQITDRDDALEMPAVPTVATRPLTLNELTMREREEVQAVNRARRLRKLSMLGNHVDRLATPALVTHLEERLPFVHPVPPPSKSTQLLLPLQGLTAWKRYSAVTERRLSHVFKHQSRPPWDLAFNYTAVVHFVADQAQGMDYQTAYVRNFGSSPGTYPQRIAALSDRLNTPSGLFPDFPASYSHGLGNAHGLAGTRGRFSHLPRRDESGSARTLGSGSYTADRFREAQNRRAVGLHRVRRNPPTA